MCIHLQPALKLVEACLIQRTVEVLARAESKELVTVGANLVVGARLEKVDIVGGALYRREGW